MGEFILVEDSFNTYKTAAFIDLFSKNSSNHIFGELF